MSKIESIKQYEGTTLDNIFFRPMLTGDSAEKLGIKVLYNVPGSSTLHFWRSKGDLLQKYTTRGWYGGNSAEKYQKKIELSKVKAELSYSAEEYFNTVYERITARPDVNLDDLSGTELEVAETAIFRSSIAESIRATMWLGDTDRDEGKLSAFDGLVKKVVSDFSNDTAGANVEGYVKFSHPQWAETLLKNLWEHAPEALRSLRSEGQLAFFVTTDVYNAYEECLDNVALESAYLAKQNGREGLYFRGIPVVDVQLGAYKDIASDMPSSFAFLTDRRNLALAVNTSDYPGTEVRMWYNPDEMENRQRAIFMAGCDYLLPELMSVGFGAPLTDVRTYFEGEYFVLTSKFPSHDHSVETFELTVYDQKGNMCVDAEPMDISNGEVSFRTKNVVTCSTYVIHTTFAISGLCVDGSVNCMEDW